MRHVDLFSGIGGFTIAAERAGLETVAFAEIDKFACRVLAHRWPDVPNLGDVTRIDGAELAQRFGEIGVVTAGFPCQPVSVAGQRKGTSDNRWLWDEVIRITAELVVAGCRPIVLAENVPGLLSWIEENDEDVEQCVCGWVGGWRGVYSDSSKHADKFFGDHPNWDDGKGATNSYSDARSIRGDAQSASQVDGSMGDGYRLDSDRADGACDIEGNSAAPRVEARSSPSRDRVGRIAYGLRGREGESGAVDGGCAGQGAMPEGAHARTQSQGASAADAYRTPGRCGCDCPACGRELGHGQRTANLVWRNAAAEVCWSLAEIGARDVGYCVLDAQYFGVPQRRRRVFVVADFGGECAGEVLFEPEGVRRNHPPRREAGEGIARPLGSCAAGGSGYRNDADTADNLIASTLTTGSGGGRYDKQPHVIAAVTAKAAKGTGGPSGDECQNLLAFQNTGHGWWNESDVAQTIRTPDGGGSLEANIIAHALTAEGHDASEDGTGRGTPLVACYDDPRRFDARGVHRGGEHGDRHPPLNTTVGQQIIAFANTVGDTTLGISKPGFPPLTTHHGDPGNVAGTFGVRRITPIEAERLQGFPDGWTAIQNAADGPRYRALGNSVAVPVVEWIMRRIAAALRQRDERAA